MADFPQRVIVKKAFTLYEVILILIVIAIILAIAIPRLKSDRLEEATQKVIFALKYTKHLALIDNKYIPSPRFSTYSNNTQKEKDAKFWFKKWWIFYLRTDTSSTADDSMPGPDMVVFSDNPSTYDNNRFNRYPSKNEIAKDPQTGRLISGRKFDSGFSEKDIDRSYNLSTYNIKKIEIDSECSTKNKILFDNLGRPHCIKPDDDPSLNPYDAIIKNRITIKICLDEDCKYNSKICIEPRSGYIHKCN